MGFVMVLRIVGVILAAQVARAGDGRAVAAGLGKLGAPRLVAASIDAVMALLGGGGGGGGGGRGRGGGGGGRGQPREPGSEGFWAALRRISRGDVAPIVRRIDVHIGRVEDHLRDEGFDDRERDVARDVTVIAGVSLTMLGIKALKVLPNIPFAPRLQDRDPDAALRRGAPAHEEPVRRHHHGADHGDRGVPGRGRALRALRDPQAHHARHRLRPDRTGDGARRTHAGPDRLVAAGGAHRRGALRDHLRRHAAGPAAAARVGAPGPGARAAHDLRRTVRVRELAAGARDERDEGAARCRPGRATQAGSGREDAPGARRNEQACDGRRQDPHHVEPDARVAGGPQGHRAHAERPRVRDHARRRARQRRRAVDLRPRQVGPAAAWWRRSPRCVPSTS